MKTAKTNDVPERALRDWRVEPRCDPQFRAGVWARIEAMRQAPTWTGYVRAHAALATGLMVVALVSGGWIGREQARARTAADRAALAENYVRALDARTMHMP